MSESDSKSKYLGIQEIANILGCSWNLVRNHIVPNVAHVRVGRKIMVHEESFNQYLKKLERGA